MTLSVSLKASFQTSSSSRCKITILKGKRKGITYIFSQRFLERTIKIWSSRVNRFNQFKTHAEASFSVWSDGAEKLVGSLIGTNMSWDQITSCMSGLVTHRAGESGVFPCLLAFPFCLPWVGAEHGPLQTSITHQKDILRFANSWVQCTSVLNKVPTTHLFTLQNTHF